MKYAVLSLLLISLSLSTFGQISHGGEPYRWNSKDVLSYENYQLPEVDLKTLQEEDIINDKLKSGPYRFGKNVEVDIDIHNNGIWTELENGDGIWRLALSSKGATSLNFVFDSYIVPEGGQIFIYTEDKTQLLGSFTHENASKNNSLGVGLIFSEKAIIEYYEPANVKGEGYLHINNVTHGYRDILVNVEREEKGAFGNSDECNINVNCPTDIDIDFQKRSVAVIVVNNNGVCSGAMVNNTLQDGTPFFLTANHCLPGNTNFTQNWIFYFNHETPGCSGNNGPTNQSISGGTLLSSNDESDFALLELNDTPPSSYNVCYSGWDATDSEGSVSSAYGIHHPRGDVKKICFEEDAPYHQNLGTFVNQTWFIDQWEEGVTEGGSSGSPLFNQNGLLIGQLAGGLAACDGEVNNGSFDYYGRMGVSWTFGNSPSNAIRFYLDQSGSGTLIVPNSCNTNLPDLNASLGVITGIPESSCELSPFTSSVNVVNLGVETIEEIVLEVNLNGNTESVDWSGNIAPQEDTFVPLGTFTPSDGVNNFTVEIISINGDEDTDELGNVATRIFEAFEQALEISVIINLDNWPGETTWNITDDFNEVVASGGSYSDDDDPVNETVCLEDGCYDFTIFDSANDGICCGFGQGSYSVVDQFGTVLASGGEFGSSETTQICAALDTQSTANSELTLFPNPATNVLKIDAGSQVIDRISIFDISGKLITEKNLVNSPKTFFNINALPSGLYVVEVVGANGFSSREKVVVAKEE
jgi:hypothetical protein